MYRPDKYLDQHLEGHIDFRTFHLLAIVPRKRKPAVILLAPKSSTPHSYFNLQYGQHSMWYVSLEDMLSAARACCGLSRYQIWQCRRRYRSIQRRTQK